VSQYSHLTLAELLDAFASSQPVPGGGSAAALAGAVGASLLIMVAGLPRLGTERTKSALHSPPLRRGYVRCVRSLPH
jgi:formiminotetrahydrofolate cyclodeaminase